MDIQCLSSKTARTAGDALRELDAMQVSRPCRLKHEEVKIIDYVSLGPQS